MVCKISLQKSDTVGTFHPLSNTVPKLVPILHTLSRHAGNVPMLNVGHERNLDSDNSI